MKSFLQTTEWLEFQKSVGHAGWRFDNGKIRANIIRHNVPFGKNYLYIPHGPEISFDEISGGLKNELAQFVAYLKNLAREQNSFYIKMEPLDDKVPEVLHDFRFKKSKKELQPRRTVIMDLEKSEPELLAAMHHKTRYNIKVAEKYNLTFKAGTNMEAFWKLLKHTAVHDNFSTHPKSYYEKLCSTPGITAETIFVEHGGQPVAGAIWLAFGDTAYYLHGAMDRNPKYKPMMAAYFLHWEAMKMAKKYNMKHYDFWGIDAAKYPGVTRFKLGWGGRQIEYPGSFDLSVKKFWYFVYKTFRR
ncbi:MAG TPA: peptidoglycan bridge formation glycyltransferase FemA/FemB family protein [Candidatus Paceibacterota bacterium]|nr:peptidoglycan bridge formation glycyltransferase FemA/FemB family protein [Candidatus Paceibacterota bacterium]